MANKKAKTKKAGKKTSSHGSWLFIAAAAVVLATVGIIWDLKRPQPAPDSNMSLAQPAAELSASQCAEKLPVGVLAGQVLMIGLPASQMADQASLFKRYHVGGAVLMSSPDNPKDGGIMRFKTAGGVSGDPLLISTDEEGGLVQRFKSLGALPAPEDAAKNLTPAQSQQMIADHAAKLKSVGIDMILGPLADVAPQYSQSPLGSRVFSADPRTVAIYDSAYVKGWQSAGLLPVLKHFPGLGSATGNTDFQPAVTPPLSHLMLRDFIPYRALSGAGAAVMVGNQNVPGWFSGPASLSPLVNQYLRQVLGYDDSLVVTDSLDAAAITTTTTVAEAVVEAIAAGNDMVLIVNPSADDITAAGNRRFISQAEDALRTAAADSPVFKQALAKSAARKLAAQSISACSLL